ncbi:MAG: hypothetical protein HeimC2_31310 [Candidatus Heimdallarchaeota archaeon LC_2]|nr:MAG: hypothetical protein HeimC2_31310 [Candidatus Heimdallarchaeota archaeon LC_2]
MNCDKMKYFVFSIFLILLFTIPVNGATFKTEAKELELGSTFFVSIEVTEEDFKDFTFIVIVQVIEFGSSVLEVHLTFELLLFDSLENGPTPFDGHELSETLTKDAPFLHFIWALTLTDYKVDFVRIGYTAQISENTGDILGGSILLDNNDNVGIYVEIDEQLLSIEPLGIIVGFISLIYIKKRC